MNNNLTYYYHNFYLNYIDLKLARFFSARDTEPGSLVPLAFALASYATTMGHVCSETNGIGRLARAVKQGDAAAAIDTLEDPGNRHDLTWIHGASDTLPGILADHILDGYRGYLTSPEAEKALEIFNRFRIL